MNNLSIKKCEDTVEWISFCRSSKQGSIYVMPDFMDAAGIEYDLWFGYLDDELVAAIPILMKNGKPFSKPPALLRYYGIMFTELNREISKKITTVCNATVTCEFLEKLSTYYNNFLFVCSPALNDLRGFKWFNDDKNNPIDLELLYTGTIDLEEVRDFELYISNIRSSRRQDIRKALSGGCTLSISTDWNTFREIYRMTFARQGIVDIHNSDTQTLENITKAAIQGGFGEMIMASTPNGETISGAVFLFDDRTAYYFAGANHPEKRNYGAGSLVLLEGIKRAWERGLKYFDVCGVNSPSRGDYKTSFDASLVPYFTAIWSRSEML